MRARDWEMDRYIYDNFFEIQVVLEEDGDEDHGDRGDELLLKGEWDLTINRKRGSRQWQSDIKRR